MIHESAVMRQFAVPKEPRQHRERVLCEHRVDERFLTHEGSGRAAGGQCIPLVECRLCDLWE
ncbi:MAG: hypothetical protein ACRD4Q_02420 [Candidatus Acidiferrales bacterium]